MSLGQEQHIGSKMKHQPQEYNEAVNLLVIADGSDRYRGQQDDPKSEEEESRLFPRIHWMASYPLNALFLLAAAFMAGMFCSKFLLRAPTAELYADRVMEKFRFEAASASIEIMLNNPMEQPAAVSTIDESSSGFVDIGPFSDVVEKALDTVGVRGVYTDLLETQKFAVALTAAAKAKGILDFYVDQQHFGRNGHAQPSFTVLIINNYNDTTPETSEYCTGCPWWLRHWIGAITADKLLRDGSLLLESTTGERIHDATGVFKEIQRIERMPYTDILPFHAQHGFAWHYIALTRPGLDEYPLDLAENWCGDLLYTNEYVEHVHTDIAGNCRHAFGHAVFYNLFMRETGGSEHFSVRQQFQPRGGFFLSDEALCEGIRICHGAPSTMSVSTCMDGFRHSVRLASYMNPNMNEYVNKLENETCKW